MEHEIKQVYTEFNAKTKESSMNSYTNYFDNTYIYTSFFLIIANT